MHAFAWNGVSFMQKVQNVSPLLAKCDLFSLDSKLQILNNVTQFGILEKFHIQIGNFINWRIWSILVVYSCTKIVGYFAVHVRYTNIVHRERFKQVFYFIIKHTTNIENRDPKACTTRYKWKALEIFGYMRSYILYKHLMFFSECGKNEIFLWQHV